MPPEEVKELEAHRKLNEETKARLLAVTKTALTLARRPA